MQNNSTVSSNSNEVDLRVLMSDLWRQRFVIIGAVIISTVIAAAYALLSKPIYEARVVVVPPAQNDVVNYNYGRTPENELAPFSVKDVYGVFLRNLQAESLRRELFYKTYLPSLTDVDRSKSKETLYNDFSKVLTVSIAGKDNPDGYTVSVKDEHPEQAVILIGEYIGRASELAKKEIINNISSEADVLVRNMQQQIILIREVGLKSREDSIAKLREALVVAEAIGLEKPPIVSGGSEVKVAGSLDEQPLYMRGTKALKAEIEILETRKSNDPFINKLRVLQAKSKFYADLESNIRGVEVFRMDGQVELPDTPVQPKKVLVVFLGVILGLIFGVVIAFFRTFNEEK